MSEFIPISEFQHITKLNDQDLLTMLENGELTISTGPLGELLIDITDLSEEKIATRSPKKLSQVPSEDVALLEEKVAAEMAVAFDGLVDEALGLALRWHGERKGEKYN